MTKWLRDDALVRFALGIEGIPPMNLKKYAMYLQTVPSDEKQNIRETARVLANELGLPLA